MEEIIPEKMMRQEEGHVYRTLSLRYHMALFDFLPFDDINIWVIAFLKFYIWYIDDMTRVYACPYPNIKCREHPW